ncbi:hypothetical protein Moror_12052 [Moniliophthora roreri MCA 2997]|uniref:Uncharacterized protein n=2 Tax=Moniliophthora roreri TaxID=221103 RepID=V2W9W9_MONRO|nr:hypothetical protein Moror_12052 [Moniliophthora roreri MCA 2997]
MLSGSNTPVKSQGRKNNPNLDEAGNLDHTEEMERANRCQATLRYLSRCPSPFNAGFCAQREKASGVQYYLTASLALKTSVNPSHPEFQLPNNVAPPMKISVTYNM